MVGRAAAEAPLAGIPELPQRGVVLVVDHGGDALLQAAHGVVALAHLEEGLHDIAFHIGAGVFLRLEYIEYLAILGLVGDARDDGKSLYAVIGSAHILGMAVAVAVPTVVVTLLDLLHSGAILGCVGIEAHHVGHTCHRVECHVVPAGENEPDVAVVAPVAPQPSGLVGCCKPGGVERETLKVSAHGRIDLADGGRIARIHIVIPETIESYGCQHLSGQLALVGTGHGRVEYSLIGLPGSQFEHALAHQVYRRERQRVESLAGKYHLVAPPLCALALGTVKIGVAHIDIERIECFLPETVIEIVVRVESTHYLGIITRLAVAYTVDLDALGEIEDNLLAVHPAQRLVLLLSLTCHILCPDVPGASHVGVVGPDVYGVATLGGSEVYHGCHLQVAGEEGDDGVATGTLVELEAGSLDAEVLEHGYRTACHLAPWAVAPGSNLDRGREAVLGRDVGSLPSVDGMACVVADVALGESEVGHLACGCVIGGMDAAHPAGVGTQLGIIGVDVEA